MRDSRRTHDTEFPFYALRTPRQRYYVTSINGRRTSGVSRACLFAVGSLRWLPRSRIYLSHKHAWHGSTALARGPSRWLEQGDKTGIWAMRLASKRTPRAISIFDRRFHHTGPSDRSENMRHAAPRFRFPVRTGNAYSSGTSRRLSQVRRVLETFPREQYARGNWEQSQKVFSRFKFLFIGENRGRCLSGANDLPKGKIPCKSMSNGQRPPAPS